MSAGSRTTETGLLTAALAAVIIGLGMLLGPRIHHTATDTVPDLTNPSPTQAIGQAVGDLTGSPFALVLAALFLGLAVALVVTALTGSNGDDQ